MKIIFYILLIGWYFLCTACTHAPGPTYYEVDTPAKAYLMQHSSLTGYTGDYSDEDVVYGALLSAQEASFFQYSETSYRQAFETSIHFPAMLPWVDALTSTPSAWLSLYQQCPVLSSQKEETKLQEIWPVSPVDLLYTLEIYLAQPEITAQFTTDDLSKLDQLAQQKQTQKAEASLYQTRYPNRIDAYYAAKEEIAGLSFSFDIDPSNYYFFPSENSRKASIDKYYDLHSDPECVSLSLWENCSTIDMLYALLVDDYRMGYYEAISSSPASAWESFMDNYYAMCPAFFQTLESRDDLAEAMLKLCVDYPVRVSAREEVYFGFTYHFQDMLQHEIAALFTAPNLLRHFDDVQFAQALQILQQKQTAYMNAWSANPPAATPYFWAIRAMQQFRAEPLE